MGVWDTRRAPVSLGGLLILVAELRAQRSAATDVFGFFDLGDEAWIEFDRPHVMSERYLVRYALPWLSRSAASCIVNVTSISDVVPGTFNQHHTVTNAGVINLTECLAI